MQSPSGDRRRKRSRVVRWIVIAFVVCALAEPVIMYKVLVNERQQRSAASQALSSSVSTNTVSGE